MARYNRGYDRSLHPSSGDWASPHGSGRGLRHDREHSGQRPWVGGYRDGFQGGSSGIPVGRGRFAGEGTGGDRYDRFRADAGAQRRPRGAGEERGGYGGDYWWLGERAFDHRRERTAYDDAYARFDKENRPRYSPVGGNYHAMGGEYSYRRPPEPLREERWFSDWTRWF